MHRDYESVMDDLHIPADCAMIAFVAPPWAPR